MMSFSSSPSRSPSKVLPYVLLPRSKLSESECSTKVKLLLPVDSYHVTCGGPPGSSEPHSDIRSSRPSRLKSTTEAWDKQFEKAVELAVADATSPGGPPSHTAEILGKPRCSTSSRPSPLTSRMI